MNIDAIRKQHPITVDDLPAEEFFAILYPESVTTPGDERSKTHPGHGYPEHTSHHWRMEVYPSREAWESDILRLESQAGYMRRAFKAIRAIPAKITKSVSVAVE